MQEPTKCAIYTRVSTRAQNPDTQLGPLRKYALDRGFIIVKEHIDIGYSGATARRPALDSLMADVRARRVGVVLVWRFDRFARSVRHLVNALEEFRHLGVAFVSMTEQVDTASPLGAAMFSIVAAIAQLEKDIIRERVMAGLNRARAEGRVLGRPRVEVAPERVAEVYASCQSVRATAATLKVSASTVQRLLKSIRLPQAV